MALPASVCVCVHTPAPSPPRPAPYAYTRTHVCLRVCVRACVSFTRHSPVPVIYPALSALFSMCLLFAALFPSFISYPCHPPPPPPPKASLPCPWLSVFLQPLPCRQPTFFAGAVGAAGSHNGAVAPSAPCWLLHATAGPTSTGHLARRPRAFPFTATLFEATFGLSYCSVE